MADDAARLTAPELVEVEDVRADPDDQRTLLVYGRDRAGMLHLISWTWSRPPGQQVRSLALPGC